MLPGTISHVRHTSQEFGNLRLRFIVLIYNICQLNICDLKTRVTMTKFVRQILLGDDTVNKDINDADSIWRRISRRAFFCFLLCHHGDAEKCLLKSENLMDTQSASNNLQCSSVSTPYVWCKHDIWLYHKVSEECLIKFVRKSSWLIWLSIFSI